MSRVHDALRKAGLLGHGPAGTGPADAAQNPVIVPGGVGESLRIHLEDLADAREFAFEPASESHLMTLSGELATDAPYEEIRSLRTRLNHLQQRQGFRSLLITSPSPAEGKSFLAANLAIAEAQLGDNPTVLADFDLRRPVQHELFGISKRPGLTDYLRGDAELVDIVWRARGSHLYVIPAGSSVINPLELLNLPRTSQLIDALEGAFRWVILDSPPLLFAADANLLSTLAEATLLVVRLGQTTIDAVNRAVQSLCENNVVGVVVNGASRHELYSKYTYYARYYSSQDEAAKPVATGSETSG